MTRPRGASIPPPPAVESFAEAGIRREIDVHTGHLVEAHDTVHGLCSKFRLDLRYRQREYPRAFIFDKEVNPGTGLDNPAKAYDIAEARVRGELPSFARSSFYVEAELRLQEAADPRYTYDRLRISMGLEWAF